MIKNINLLQNPKDIEFDKYSEEYIIQALANLGQRIGIKGDGISYKHFTFSEICDEQIPYSLNDHIGYIRYIKGEDDNEQYKGIFGIVDKKTLTDYKLVSESISINNCLYFPTQLSFDIPVNNIDCYAKNCICINNDENDELTYMLAGKYIGADNDDDFNTSLYYYKYDVNLNKLKYGAKLFHIDSNNNENLVCLLNIINKTYKENNYSGVPIGNEYILNVYIYNVNYLSNNEYRNDFNNIFKYSTYNSAFIPFSIIKYEYENLSNLINYNDDESLNFYNNSAIALILNSSQDSLYSSYSLSLTYDNNNFIIDDNNTNVSIINLYKNEYNVNITQEVFELNEDNINLYYNIFNYYNNKYYLNSRTEFIKRILLKLYENISDNDYTENILYIPLDYQFHYICNSNNELNIYYSNNLYVTFTQLNKLNLEDFFTNNKNLVYDYTGIDKVKCFNFELNYNSNDDTLINNLLIKPIYTMPYINAANNWSINDEDSKIYAIGKDAGNPNIIIINTYNDGIEYKYEVLNTINNKTQKIDETEYTQKWFSVNPALFNNSSDIGDNIECCTFMPILNDNNIDYFKNCIILSLSHKDCISENYKDNYMSSYVLSIWHVIENNQKYEFDYIKQNSDNKKYAICLGTTLNLLNSLNDDNNSIQNMLVLKAVITQLGQEILSVTSNNYLVIKNKLSEEYQEISNSVNEYRNDLNGIIQYYDTVNKNIYSQTNRYITDNSEIVSTNSLYPVYKLNSKEIELPEEVTSVISEINENTSEFIRTSKIYVDDNYITNTESLEELLYNSTYFETENIQNTVKVIRAEKTENNYSEYTFNTNVPTLDFAEVFNRNFNVLNRINIVSLDNDGKLYNAYLGTSYDENNKSVLHIGSTQNNINIGSESLMSEVDKQSFNIHNTLSLDFDKIIFNSSETCSKTTPYIKRDINNITYYIANNVTLIGTYGNIGNDETNEDDIKNKIFVHNTQINNFTASIEELRNLSIINLNNIIYSIFNEDIIKKYTNNTDTNTNTNNFEININITDKLEKIKDVNNNGKKYLENNGKYLLILNEKEISIFNDESENSVYYNNVKLNIIYSEYNNTLNIYISVL